MEDRRVLKSKRALRQALMVLLRQQTFEQIKVTELCRAADVSRITFYAHYEDKYALVDEISRDLLETAQADYRGLQRRNNSGGDPIQSFLNLLDCIINLHLGNGDFFTHVSARKNPYLYHTLYRYVSENVAHRMDAERGALSPKYSRQGISDFLCQGMWGFISRRLEERAPMETIRAEARDLLRSLLASGALMECR